VTSTKRSLGVPRWPPACSHSDTPRNCSPRLANKYTSKGNEFIINTFISHRGQGGKQRFLTRLHRADRLKKLNVGSDRVIRHQNNSIRVLRPTKKSHSLDPPSQCYHSCKERGSAILGQKPCDSKTVILEGRVNCQIKLSLRLKVQPRTRLLTVYRQIFANTPKALDFAGANVVDGAVLILLEGLALHSEG